MAKTSVVHERGMAGTDRPLKSTSVYPRSPRVRNSGRSRVSLLIFALMTYGFYALVTKPSNKVANKDAETTIPIAPQIVIYTTPSCEPCDRAKAWMKQRKIAFEERDVEASAAYEEELKNYKSRIVPVIVVNGEPQYGFEWAYLDDAIKKASHLP